MSLTNVLLIHVSTMFLPQTPAAERVEQEDREYYAILDIAKFSALPEIRKAFRRVTLKIQCDRMMLEWNYNTSHSPTGTEEAGATTGDASAANSTTNTVQQATATPNQREQQALYQKAVAALDERETRVKEAFRILGDRHLRQQYHLLQCRPSRYRILRGPFAVIHALTHSRKWFPFLILQSVIVYVLYYINVLYCIVLYGISWLSHF